MQNNQWKIIRDQLLTESPIEDNSNIKKKIFLRKIYMMTGTQHTMAMWQMVGQFLWCFAHTLWIGNSFTLTTSFGLVAHHLFGVWHGDKRLSEKHGEAYEVLKKRTSVIPFAAILDGRQKLPEEYYKEFFRLPYFVIAVITVGAYWSQPILQGASRYLKWWVTVSSQISESPGVTASRTTDH